MRINPATMKAIHEQAKDMLENVSAVRGDDYASLVKAALTAMSVTQLFCWALDMSDEEASDENVVFLQRTFNETLTSLVDRLVDLTGAPQDVVRDAFSEAMTINDTVAALMNKAATGRSFG